VSLFPSFFFKFLVLEAAIYANKDVYITPELRPGVMPVTREQVRPRLGPKFRPQPYITTGRHWSIRH